MKNDPSASARARDDRAREPDVGERVEAAALDSVAAGVTVQDARGRLVYANLAAAELVGLPSVDAMLRASATDLVAAFEVFDADGQPLPPSELPGRRLLDGRDRGGPRERLLRFRLRGGAGGECWALVAARALPMGPQSPPYVVNTFIDASEVVKAQQHLRLAIEAGNLGTWQWDIAGGRVQWSAELERMHGLEPGTFEGTFEAYQRDMHPEDRARVLGEIRGNLARGSDHKLLYRIVRPDGAVRWLEAHGRFELAADGQPQRLTGVCTDVTERVQAEEARTRLAAELAGQRAEREAAARTQAVLAAISDAFAVCARDWTIVFANDESAKRLGRPAAQVIGRVLWELAPGARGTPFEAALRRAMAERTVTRIEERAGDSGWLEVIAYPLPDGGLAVYSRDITARKRVESELDERARELDERARELARSNAELEQFAYVASHDLQEPLRIVASYTQLLARRYRGKLDDDADEFIAFSVDGIARMQRLIADLLAYSRVGSRAREPAPVDVERVLAIALDNLAHAVADAGARVTHDPLPAVLGEEGQLVQLLQNLISNAVKFRGAAPPAVHVSARRDGEAPEWTFAVADNGVGIEAQYFERIFVIFQRLHARESYPGTGIGLALCKKIVERHGGRIWVESAPGAGSTFSFTLPVGSGAPS